MEITNGCKGKTLSNIRDGPFLKVVTSYRDEFRIFPNNYGGALVFLQTMIILKNVMKLLALK